jgi:hypothetical protein
MSPMTAAVWASVRSSTEGLPHSRGDKPRRRWCELCDHGATVTVHHVATLAQLGKPGPGQPAWAALMARKRRKTLIVCRSCHDYIHANPVANAA